MELSKLPNPVQLAIPAFITLILIEFFWGKVRKSADYEVRDTAASLSMGLGNIIIGLLTGIIIYGMTTWAYQFRLFEIGHQWWAFVAVFFLEDFIYYWYHRWSHENRWLWSAHIVHHSSQHMNLSTALRQTWTGFLVGGWLLWLPLAWIGFSPQLIAFQKGVSLVYQFWFHTEAIKTMGPFEWIFNTPSHHRVHHATNTAYLDRNYAGILIIWDRMFGTFEPEDAKNNPCKYGLIHRLGTFNPFKIAFHELASIVKDASSKGISLKARFLYIFGPPGWSHDGSRTTVKDMKRAEKEQKA